jgi:hypothetical protein
MNAKYQLSAPVALVIILCVAVSTTVLLIHAISSVDFTSIAQADAPTAQ